MQLQKAAQLEAKHLTNQTSGVSVVESNKKRLKGSNTLSTSSVSYTDLGASINPFSSFLNGRNYVAVNPTLNTVALFRRGYQSDPVSGGGNNGNKLFYDISNGGGEDGTWQLGNGPLYSHTGYDTTVNNFGARYPQGVLWNPPSNVDPANVIAFGNARVLDGTNGSWGGLAKGWKVAGSASAAKQTLWQSPEPLHFRTETMEVTSQGDVFLVEPEEDVSGDVTFTDKIMVYKYSYNTATATFDSTVFMLPFANEGGDYKTSIGSTAIAFAPDGQNGFLVVAAFNNTYDSVGAYTPYISKTTDGGTTWSDWKLIGINYRYSSYDSPSLDALRDSMFVGSFVHFTEAGEIVRGVRGEEYVHKVDYTINDLDLIVDQFGYAHVLANFSICGFGDTLFSDPVSGLTYYPGYGSWNVDLFIKNMEDSVSAFVISDNNALNGCWGDCAGTENIKEGNRPQAARSADGSTLAFCWFDTDLEAHPQLTEDENSNPDMWMQRIKVEGPGLFRANPPKNMSKGTDNDGIVIQGSVAPLLLNAPGGYKVAATAVNIPQLPAGATTAVWPTQHYFINGLDIPTAVDSFPTQIVPFSSIVSNRPSIASIKSGSGSIAYPNPTSGNLEIYSGSELEKISGFEIRNLLGQSIMKKRLAPGQNSAKMKLDVTSLSQGIYWLQVETGSGSKTQRIIKN